MRLRVCLIFFVAFTAGRCGVEAGNAGTTKKTGTMNLYFAQESTSGESLSLQLASLELVGAEGSDTVSLAPAVESIDLFSLTSDKVVVAQSVTIPIGNYRQIAVRLQGAEPIRYRDNEGNDRSVAFEDAASSAFYLERSFSVSENGTTSLLISMDPHRSLQAASDSEDSYLFKPRGDIRPSDLEAKYQSTTSVENAQWVCAYAFSIDESLISGGILPIEGLGIPLLDGLSHKDSKAGLLPTDDILSPILDLGEKVEGRDIFSNKDSVLKDETDECLNAFAKTPVVGGRFDLRHLLPGTYSLRVFTSSGTYVDLPEDVILQGE